MKIEVFATLDAVLEGGSFAAAAQRMNLTPSAVSMQMGQLERWLGQTLFDRSGPQVRPTAMAREVAATLSDGLQHLGALRRRTSLAVEGVVRLGVIESMLPVLLPGATRYLRDRFPGLALRPVRGRSSGLTENVKAGTLDAAIVAQPDKGRLAGLHWHALERRDLVLIAPPNATEASVAALLRQHDWIRYDRGTVTGALAVRFVHAQVPTKRPSIELDSVPAIVAMVSTGLGVSVVQISDPSVTLAYPVRLVRLGRATPTLQFALVTRKADDDDRRLLALREAVEATLATAVRRGRSPSSFG